MTDQEYCVEVDVDLKDLCDENNEIKETAKLVIQPGDDQDENLRSLLRVLLADVGNSPDTAILIDRLVVRSNAINQSGALSWTLTICVKIFKWRIWVVIKRN